MLPELPSGATAKQGPAHRAGHADLPANASLPELPPGAAAMQEPAHRAGCPAPLALATSPGPLPEAAAEQEPSHDTDHSDSINDFHRQLGLMNRGLPCVASAPCLGSELLAHPAGSCGSRGLPCVASAPCLGSELRAHPASAATTEAATTAATTEATTPTTAAATGAATGPAAAAVAPAGKRKSRSRAVLAGPAKFNAETQSMPINMRCKVSQCDPVRTSCSASQTEAVAKQDQRCTARFAKNIGVQAELLVRARPGGPRLDEAMVGQASQTEDAAADSIVVTPVHLALLINDFKEHHEGFRKEWTRYTDTFGSDDPFQLSFRDLRAFLTNRADELFRDFVAQPARADAVAPARSPWWDRPRGRASARADDKVSPSAAAPWWYGKAKKVSAKGKR